MSVRSHPRLRRTGAAACVLALAAAAPAAAQPARDCSCGGARVPAPSTTAPVPQSAPTWPTHPQTLTLVRHVSASAGEAFQWDDAGIGAAGGVAIALAGLGAAVVIRRRRPSEPPLAA